MAETPSKRKRSAGSEDVDKALYSCQLCQRTYERQDHLTRHLDSHRNERTFRCSDCPRGFNRRDLLLRHQATHTRTSSGAKTGKGRQGERAIKACDACVISKLKCDNERPCQRCQKRRIDCSTDSLDQQRPQQNGDGQDSFIRSIPTPPDQSPEDAPQAPSSLSVNRMATGQTTAVSLDDDGLMTAMTDWQFPDLNLGPYDFPSFFEHIMVPGPDYVSAESMQVPPDISTLMPDKDWFDDTNIFGLDFTPTIDQALEATTYGFPELNTQQDQAVEDSGLSRATDAAQRRHTIFQRSPWLWKPESNQNAFSEHNSIPLDERSIDMATSPHQPFLPSLVLEDRLLPQTRDNIFQLVIKTAKSQVTIPTFPSAKCLETLLKVGIAKRVETDAWIHPYTLCSETARPELLTALIAAGCVCFGIPSVSKTGLLLFEIARVALARLIEDDNSVIRDLQYLQASMMWIDICAFCGFKRKMEIAESNLQPLITALRRFGKFDRVAYDTIVPTYADSGEGLEAKWKRWTDQESYKRLVHHVFEHDIYTTIAKVRNPLVSYAEMTLPLPASRDIWLAPNAEAWKATYLEKAAGFVENGLSVRDLLADSELVKCLPSTVDNNSAKILQLYGLAALTWEQQQQSQLLSSPFASVDPSSKLWLESRHQKLYETLQRTRSLLQDCSAVARLFHEFLMMSLHVNADEITRFAGKCGEDEAHRAYKELQSWVSSKQSRKAVWHAAQVLRAARAVPPYQLRGSDAFLIYHAVMVLWSYGMLKRDAARRTGSATPANGSTNANTGSFERQSSDIVVLDGESDRKMEAFLVMGSGRACLQIDTASSSSNRAHQPQLCDLDNPQVVMAVGVKVLEGNYPGEARDKLPQLIKSLCDLMSELGSLR